MSFKGGFLDIHPIVSLQDPQLDPPRVIIRPFQQLSDGVELFNPFSPKATEHTVLKPVLGPNLIFMRMPRGFKVSADTLQYCWMPTCYLYLKFRSSAVVSKGQ